MDGTPPPAPFAVVEEEHHMRASLAGQTFIHSFEACRLKAYKDVKGVWTLGWGHTSSAGPPRVTAGMVITQAEADAIFARDIANFERDVTSLTNGIALAQHEFDALVSLAYNIGTHQKGFAGSSVLKRLREGQRQEAADAMRLWNKSGKLGVVKGLVNRRAAERRLFLTGDYGAPRPEEHKPLRPGPAG